MHRRVFGSPVQWLGNLLLMALAGCATQPQADGSTKVHISIADALGIKAKAPDAASAPARSAAPAPQQAAPAAPAAPPLRSSKLAGLFTKHPYDGTPKSHYPRVAVTVTDWSRSDCWTAVATVWWNKSKSEAVPPFSVCWGSSLGFAVNNAANMHLFIQQSSFEHSGNVRSRGPKPPMLAVPDRQPIGESQQLAFQGFIQQLVLDTGWGPGAPTNMWLVGYDANAAKAD